jgi:N2-acetyl-L-2,4-diaminobutanoate deacetylase
MVTTSINFDKPGKQQGFLQVPYSHNLGGWGNVLIPTTSVSNRAGPTALVLAGNHGDEYQGQIAIMKLARELTLEMVTGRIILIPSLNFAAARAATRLSPVDGFCQRDAGHVRPSGEARGSAAPGQVDLLNRRA